MRKQKYYNKGNIITLIININKKLLKKVKRKRKFEKQKFVLTRGMLFCLQT